MFKARILTEDDYDMLSPWYKWHRFPQPPKDCLPNNGLGGIMITKDGIDIVAGYLYFTNSKMTWLEFIVSNPKYKENDRKEAIEFLINELSEIAKSKGFSVVFTSVKKEGLINRYLACGFTDAGKASELVRML